MPVRRDLSDQQVREKVVQKAELLGDALVQYSVIIYFCDVSDAQIIAGHLISSMALFLILIIY